MLYAPADELMDVQQMNVFMYIMNMYEIER